MVIKFGLVMVEEIAIKELSRLSSDDMRSWLCSYLKYGSSTLFDIPLGEVDASSILPKIIQDVEFELHLVGRDGEFKKAANVALQEVLSSLKGDEHPEMIADLISLFSAIPVYEGLAFLLDFDQMRQEFLESETFGTSNLRRHLLSIMFSIPHLDSCDKIIFDRLDALALSLLRTRRYPDLAFRYLKRMGLTDGWSHLPLLVEAAMLDASVNLAGALRTFLDTCTPEDMEKQFPHVSEAIRSIRPFTSEPWSLFEQVVHRHGKFHFIPSLDFPDLENMQRKECTVYFDIFSKRFYVFYIATQMPASYILQDKLIANSREGLLKVLDGQLIEEGSLSTDSQLLRHNYENAYRLTAA
jgi:hypothetical protein